MELYFFVKLTEFSRHKPYVDLIESHPNTTDTNNFDAFHSPSNKSRLRCLSLDNHEYFPHANSAFIQMLLDSQDTASSNKHCSELS